MADRESTSSNDLDMTPVLVANWLHAPAKVPTLLVHPEATLHDRVGLAFALTRELGAIAGVASSCEDDNVPRYIMHVMSEKLDKLDLLIRDIGDRTAAMSQPATA